MKKPELMICPKAKRCKSALGNDNPHCVVHEKSVGCYQSFYCPACVPVKAKKGKRK